MAARAARLAGLAPLADFVFPPRCPLCGDALAGQDGLCASCWSKLVRPGEPACASCQRPLSGIDARQGTLVCAPCLIVPPRHGGIHAATLYTPASRDLVLGLKRGRRIGHAPLLARMIHRAVPPLDGEWLVVPVPLHRWRLWRRGFNQSALIARELACGLGQPLAVDALERIRRTPSLGGMSRTARARALAGAIQVRAKQTKRLRGARILLVDDVLTSGATSDACVRALRRAGALEVRIACFARVLDEALDAQAGWQDPLAAI